MIPFLCLLLTTAPAADVEIQTLDGRTISGALSDLTEDRVALDDGSRSVELPIAQLQSLSFANRASAPESGPPVWIELVDGTLLAGRSFRAVDGQATIAPIRGEDATTPVAAIQSIRFKSQTDAQLRQWHEIRKANVRSDLIVIRKDVRIDYLEGVLGDVSDEAVQFELDGETINVNRSKVEGVIYYHRQPATAPLAVMELHDLDGSRLVGAQWSVGPEGLAIETPAGMVLKRPLEEIRSIDFAGGRLEYLSDLEPLAVDWQPFFPLGAAAALAELYRPRNDRALMRGETAADDGRLQLWISRDGIPVLRSYDKGLAVHSRTSLDYRVPEGARYFRALVGIDARVRPHGNVRLVILGDGDPLWEGDVRGDEPPQDLTVPMKGVDRMEVLVDYGDNMDVGDHLNLCNARFVK